MTKISVLLLLSGMCTFADAQTVNIPIQNPSFETATLPSSLAVGAYNNLIPGSTFLPSGGTLANWTATSTTANAWAGALEPIPHVPWPSVWWDGNNIFAVQIISPGTVTLSQTLSTTLQNGITYKLSALIANSPAPATYNYAIQLWAGSTLLSSASNFLGLVGDGNTADSAFYSSGANNPAAGQPLKVVLSVTNTGNAGTAAYFDNVTLTSTAPLVAPSITSGGIVPVYSSSPVIEPGSWVSIYGTNLAAATAAWNGDFPTSLGGTSVTINGKPAYLWFVSPTQINLQAPDDSATGTITVVVTTAAGSASSTATLGAYGPSFSLLNGKYPAAIVGTSGPGNSGGGYDIIGPAGAFAFPTRPVKAGETILLYGVGFGPTTPPVLAGHVFSGAAASPVLPRITIGGVQATVAFSGIVQAGLFQFNVVVPSVGSGDQPLVATIGGVTTPGNVFLTIQ